MSNSFVKHLDEFFPEREEDLVMDEEQLRDLFYKKRKTIEISEEQLDDIYEEMQNVPYDTSEGEVPLGEEDWQGRR